MILHDVPTALPGKEQPLGRVKVLVARVLLEHAGNGTSERRWLTQRDIATITGANWETVHVSLKLLRNEGAIRIERGRIVVDKELLQKIAGIT